MVFYNSERPLQKIYEYNFGILVLLIGAIQKLKPASFRVWFSKRHKVRFSPPGFPFTAVTAQATSDARAVIFESLLFDNPHSILKNLT